MAQVQATLRQRILRAFVGRGLLTAPHATGADRPHRRSGATAMHAPASLLWSAGTEFAAQGRLDHSGVQSEPPRIASARGPPLWDVVCRRMTGYKPSQTGIWRRNPHQTMRSISASTGDWLMRRF